MLLELATQTDIDLKDYIHLAEIVARKFYRGKEKILDTEYYAIACQSLLNAAQKYNASMGDFDRFAYRSMKNGLRSHIRFNKAKKRSATFEFLDDGEWSNIVERESNTPIPVAILSQMMADHPDDTQQDRDDKNLLNDIYLRGFSISSIADQHNVSRVTIYNRMNRITGKIRQRHSSLIEKYGDSNVVEG